ncbi:hypothetical protein OK016_13075 [Vibrio chagasii]|nr:hypothetical protein [Vibrio chagasii]
MVNLQNVEAVANHSKTHCSQSKRLIGRRFEDEEVQTRYRNHAFQHC